jgi:hypothetical protein
MDGSSYPLQFEHEKIGPIRSQDYPSVQGANGKFFGLALCGVGPYYLSVDDDILHPPDYVQSLTEKSRQSSGRAVLGVRALC